MTDIAGIEVLLDLDNNTFSEKLKRSGQDVQSFGNTVERQSSSLDGMSRRIDSVSDSLSRLSKLAVGYAGVDLFKKSVGSLIEAQKSMQAIHYGLLGALGDNRSAADTYQFISDKSQELGLDLRSTAIEFTKVTAAATAMNIPMEQQKALFDGLARSATVLHLTTDQVKYSTMALAQMFGKGKIQAEELRRQIGEQIPGVVPRFQKAVMEMTKGTDLAGISFDNLLKQGKLSTDKFLPALIQALQESGRGADEAAQSLNANLNRLSTEWFKLKADFSGGLINDALTGSVRALADSLKYLTSVAGVAGAIAAGSYLSKGLSAGGSKVDRLMQERQGEVMAAAAEKAHWETTLKRTQSEIALTQAIIRKNGESLKAAAVEKANALQLKEIAAAASDAAQKEIALATARTGKNTPKAFARRADQARAVELAAQEALTQAELKYQVVAKASQATAVEQTALRGRLAAMKAVETAETNALTVANVRLTAAERVSGILNTLGRGIKSLGSSIMSLMGGQLGMVITAVGVLGYEFMNARAEAEALRKQTEENTKTFADLMKQSDDLRQSFKEAGSAEPFALLTEDAKKFSETVEANNKQIKEHNETLATYAAARVGMFKVAGVSINLTGLEGVAAGRLAGVWQDLTGKQDALIDSNKELNESNAALTDKYNADQIQLIQSYGSAWTGVVDSLKEFTPTAAGAEDWLRRLNEGIATGTRNMSDMDAARAKWKTFSDGIEHIADAAEKKLRQKSMTAAQRLADDLKVALENAKKGGVPNADDSEAAKAARRAMVAQKGIDDAAAAKKAGAAAEREATKAAKEHENQLTSLNDRIQRQTELDHESLESDQKLVPAQRLLATVTAELASNNNRLTKAEGERYVARIKQLVIDEQKEKAAKQELEWLQKMSDLQEKLNNQQRDRGQQNEDELAGMTGGKEEQLRRARLTDLQRQYFANFDKERRDLTKDKVKENSDQWREAMAKVNESYAYELSMEEQFQRDKARLRADGTAGMKAALADFIAAATDMNNAFKTVTENALNNLTDKLTEFVTTGKFKIKDLMTSVLKEITHVLMAKAVAQFAQLILGLFGPSTSSYGGYIGGNGTGGYGMQLQTTGSANGNIMTAAGPARLNKYANGGIAKSPQLSLFGEGRLPEAYVPLPDGRSIPVTMTGGMSGMQNNVAITVNVDNDGSSHSDSKGDNEEMRKLGGLLDAKITEVMAKEMRQGGLLWKMRNG